MFTVEIESDYVKVVSIDADGKFEDVEMYLEDDGTCFIRQFSDELREFQLIAINYKQVLDLMASLDAHDGVYITQVKWRWVESREVISRMSSYCSPLLPK